MDQLGGVGANLAHHLIPLSQRTIVMGDNRPVDPAPMATRFATYKLLPDRYDYKHKLKCK